MSPATTHRLEPVLERLLALTKTVRDVEQVRSAIADAERSNAEAPRPWSESVLIALTAVGLTGLKLQMPLADRLRLVGIGQPVVARGRGQDGQETTLVLTDRKGGQVLVETPETEQAEWMSVTSLEAMASTQADEWIAVDAAMPLEPIASEPHGPSHASPLARLLWWARMEKSDLWAVAVYAAAIGVLGLTTPVAVQTLVGTVAFGTVLQPLVVLTALLFAALGLSSVLRLLQVWVVEVLQRRLFVRVVSDLAHRLPRVRRDALDRADGPELVNRFFDVFTIQKASAELLVGGLEIVLSVVVGLVVLGFYHPLLLALDAVLMLAVCLVVVVAPIARGVSTAIDESKAKYAMAAWLEELARHAPEFKLAGGHRFAAARGDALARDYLEARKAHFSVAFRQQIGMLALYAASNAAVLGVGGWLVIGRQLTLGQLVAAELVVTAVVAALAKAGKYLESFYDLLAALDKLGHLADLPVERDGGRHCETVGPARLSFDRVRGGYVGREVVSDMSFAVERGERVVITGPSGGGKSFVVEMIAGLREPSGGRVQIDGRDVRDLSLESLRERIAAVTRTATLATTVLENVRMGRASVGVAEAREAIRLVGLEDEIEALPEQLETELLPEGAPLSDGQALRLTLARAIASKPSLLVIDHVLDGIDDATREPLLEALFAPGTPWTLVVVSSDPNVIARADRVVWLENGTLRPRPSLFPGAMRPPAIDGGAS